MSLPFLAPATVGVAAGLAYIIYLLRDLLNSRSKTLAALRNTETRLREVEQQCVELCGQFDAMVDLSGIGIILLDEAGTVLRGNNDAAEWLHTTVPAMLGRGLLEATLSHELDALFLQSREVGCIRRELRVVGNNGKNDLSVTVAPIEPPAGPDGDSQDTQPGHRRYLMVLDNVTKLRRLETVRRDFVANVSHEFRTPLTSIRALAETLQQAPLTERALFDRFLAMIVAESERLTRISDDLLVLSSAESRPPAKANFNLAELLTATMGRFQRQAAKSRIQLSQHIDDHLTVHANHDQIEQVIVNLIDNAIKYTHENGRVSVTAESRNDSVYVSVSDTGIGIMQDDLSRIFERFYRVDKARSRETGGTGLGLSIVKHIIEAHGGQVSVQSEFNRGSTFTVILPNAGRSIDTAEGIVTQSRIGYEPRNIT